MSIVYQGIVYNDRMGIFSVFVIVFIEGFVSIATEMLTLRQLMPFVGNDVIVTSLIIGIFLLALAYGYRKGGLYEGEHVKVLQRNFILASIFLGVGLSYSMLLAYFLKFNLVSNMSLLVVYLLLVTAPLVYLLGQTVPISMNYAKGSKVLHLSTMGSFLGAVLTTVILMNFIGVNWTVVLNSILLLSLAYVVTKNKKQISIITLIAIFVIPAIYWLNIKAVDEKHLAANAYANYHLIDPAQYYEKQGKILSINHSASTFLENYTNKGFWYIEVMKHVLFKDLKLHDKEILVLGAGGFSLSAEKTNNNKFIYVDIDPQLERLVSNNFLDNINGSYIAQDARSYLIDNSDKYSAIIVDTYGQGISMPAHLLTREYFDLIADHLTDDGLVLLNIIANPSFNDDYSAAINNTILSSFSGCNIFPSSFRGDDFANIIYVCRNNRKGKITKLYTDNKNQALLDKAFVNLGNTSNKSATNP